MFLQLLDGGDDLPTLILIERVQKQVLDLLGQVDLPYHHSSIRYSYYKSRLIVGYLEHE